MSADNSLVVNVTSCWSFLPAPYGLFTLGLSHDAVRHVGTFVVYKPTDLAAQRNNNSLELTSVYCCWMDRNGKTPVAQQEGPRNELV